MKKNLTLSFVIISLLVTLHPMPASASAPTAEVFFHRAPTIGTPSRVEAEQNILIGMREQRSPVGTGSGRYERVTTGFLQPRDIMTFENITPRLEADFRLIGTDLQSDKIALEVSSNDPTVQKPGGTFGFDRRTLNNQFSWIKQGREYGADGVRSTDDVFKVSGTGFVQNGEILYIGFGVELNANSQALVDSWTTYFREKDLKITFRYFYDGVLVSTSVMAFQPPPLPLPVITSLTATSGSITAGQPVTLTWRTTNATSVTFQPPLVSVATTGSATVSPNADTTYILTATGPGGSTNATLFVKVVQPLGPAKLRISRFGSDSFGIFLLQETPPGKYLLEISPDLKNWTGVTLLTQPGNAAFIPGNIHHMFFRTRTVP